ncbi:MAG: tetratricopeptide repeat protein [Gillisia sp.]
MKLKVFNSLCIMVLLVFTSGYAFAQTAQELFPKAVHLEEVKGELEEAIDIYEIIVKNFADDEEIAAKAQLHLGLCYEKLGIAQAQEAYQKVVDNYPARKDEVAIARERLSRLLLAENKPGEKTIKPSFSKINMTGNIDNGVLSPDGEKVAFVSQGDVWVMPLSGKVNQYITGEPKRLTKNIGADNYWNTLCWSDDGKWIAFNVNKQDSDSTDVYVVTSNGNNLKKVVSRPFASRLSLSPDGKMLAYSVLEDYNDDDIYTELYRSIYIISVKGGEPQKLTEKGCLEPVWSPDGEKIIYVKSFRDNEGTEYSELWMIAPEGGNSQQIIKRQSGRIRGTVWSPDGTMVAFIQRPEPDGIPVKVWIGRIVKNKINEENIHKIELPLSSYHTLAGWTPDNKIGIYMMNEPYEVIYTVPSKGGIATQVTPRGWTSYPKWSPDGEKICFRWDGGKIAFIPADGGPLDIINIDSEFDIYTALPGSGNEISPDGNTIVFSGAKNFYSNNKKQLEVDIFTIPVNGGKPTQLTEAGNLMDRFPCWSPDGKHIAFIRAEVTDDEFISHIYTISKEGKNLKKITQKSDQVFWAPIDWTPDGKSVTFFSKNKTISSIPANGGESKMICKVKSVNRHFDLAWSSNGNKLAYTDEGKLWVLNNENDVQSEIKTGVDATISKIDWSPDESKIAFTAYSGGDYDLYLVENFLTPENNK